MSKYDGLTAWLNGRTTNREVLTLREIEEIIGCSLPPSARAYRPWWGNESGTGSRQCKAWLGAGWYVEEANLTQETVTLER